MRNKFLLTLLAAVLGILACSCKSDEEAVISDLKALSERIERQADKTGNKYSGFNFEDWAEIDDELQQIKEDAAYCNFTPRQAREFGYEYARLQAIILKNSIKAFSGYINNFFSPFLNGVIQGWADEAISTAEDDEFWQTMEELFEVEGNNLNLDDETVAAVHAFAEMAKENSDEISKQIEEALNESEE